MSFPKIMGVVNVTPDSFSDGGMFVASEHAIQHGLRLAEQGAQIIDIGGESTRPGAIPVSEADELTRVIPIVAGMRSRNSTIEISIDTTKSNVAREAVLNGATMVNDVSAGEIDNEMFDTVAAFQVPYILMHMRGRPADMQNRPAYSNVITEVCDYLGRRMELARSAGIQNVMIDPGIGFGKTLAHNLELLRGIDQLGALGVPVVLGISRKRMFKDLLGIESAEERDVATALMHALLSNKNVSIIRVHNVELAKMAQTLSIALRAG